MPADWLFYWMTLPTGLAVIAAGVALPFFLWRAVLGRALSGVGYKPLAAAYGLAAMGLVMVNFASAYLEFSSRVAKNILPEAQRWSTVPGWTVYTSVLSLVVVLPLLGLLGVPVSALLLRFRRLSIWSIGAASVVTCLAVVFVAWSFPGNEWHRTNRSESLGLWLKELAPGILLVALPFLAGVYLASGRYRNAET